MVTPEIARHGCRSQQISDQDGWPSQCVKYRLRKDKSRTDKTKLEDDEKKQDAKKEQVLLERGWILLRFWNGQVLGDFSSVLARIQSTIATLKGAA